MRVLGIDPGTTITGWGAIDERRGKLSCVESGVIRPRGTLPERLACLLSEITLLLERISPSAMSIEKSFVGENVQSAFRLGEARGVILAAAARANVPVAEYSPAAIKVAVAGAGRASKSQVQTMIGHLLGITGTLVADEADALAIGLCHLQSRRLASLTTLPRSSQRRGGSRLAWEQLHRSRS